MQQVEEDINDEKRKRVEREKRIDQGPIMRPDLEHQIRLPAKGRLKSQDSGNDSRVQDKCLARFLAQSSGQRLF